MCLFYLFIYFFFFRTKRRKPLKTEAADSDDYDDDNKDKTWRQPLKIKKKADEDNADGDFKVDGLHASDDNDDDEDDFEKENLKKAKAKIKKKLKKNREKIPYIHCEVCKRTLKTRHQSVYERHRKTVRLTLKLKG